MVKPPRPNFPLGILTPAAIDRVQELQREWDRKYGEPEEDE